MNSGSGSPSEIESTAGVLPENEHGHRRGLKESGGEIECLGEEQARTSGTTIGPKQWFCLFRADAGPMAVSVESVAEVLETDTLVRLAWSPPRVIGMCPYHREVVPVVVLESLEGGAQEDLLNGRHQAPATDTALAKPGIDDRARCVVLILRTEHGAWGIRVDSDHTIMCRESPEYHSPRISANGPVLIGIVRLEGTCYGILDAEATWQGLRSAVGRWSGLIGESKPCSPLLCRAEPIGASPGV